MMDPETEEAIENEIMIASTMYEEAITREEDQLYALSVNLPFSFQLRVQFPLQGYPGERFPSFIVTKGPNAVLVSEFQAALTQEIKANIELGQGDVLLLALPIAMALAEDFEHRRKAEWTEKVREEGEIEVALREEGERVRQIEKNVPFYQSSPIYDRKSKFIAHLTRVSSTQEVHEAIDYLRSQKDIAAACHPSIWAYRYRDTSGRLCADLDDDGETGASKRMMFLLEQLEVEGWLVVVTRWFGGILLGPDRFKHIMNVTREVITQCPAIKIRE